MLTRKLRLVVIRDMKRVRGGWSELEVHHLCGSMFTQFGDIVKIFKLGLEPQRPISPMVKLMFKLFHASVARLVVVDPSSHYILDRCDNSTLVCGDRVIVGEASFPILRIQKIRVTRSVLMSAWPKLANSILQTVGYVRFLQALRDQTSNIPHAQSGALLGAGTFQSVAGRFQSVTVEVYED
jgi:hypothetical protein